MVRFIVISSTPSGTTSSPPFCAWSRRAPRCCRSCTGFPSGRWDRWSSPSWSSGWTRCVWSCSQLWIRSMLLMNRFSLNYLKQRISTSTIKSYLVSCDAQQVDGSWRAWPCDRPFHTLYKPARIGSATFRSRLHFQIAQSYSLWGYLHLWIPQAWDEHCWYGRRGFP